MAASELTLPDRFTEDKREKVEERRLDLTQTNKTLLRLLILPLGTVACVNERELEPAIMPIKAQGPLSAGDRVQSLF